MSVNDTLYRFSNSSSNIAVVISCKLNNKDVLLVLDTVNETSVTASSTLTEHPMPSGEMAADHMFRNPNDVQLSGTFPLINNVVNGLLVDSSGAYLAGVQELFERIKNEGILCNIAKVTTQNNDIRFKKRENLVLINISWSEKISSVDFRFLFREVQFADVQEYDVDVDDAFLPDLEEPSSASFTDSLFDQSKMIRYIIDYLQNTGLLEEKLLSSIEAVKDFVAIEILGATAIVLAALSLIPGVNLVAWAVIAAVGAAVVFVKMTFNIIKTLYLRNKYGIKPFKYYKNEKRRNKEIKRFIEFLNKIADRFEVLNDKVKCYAISKEGQQQCLLSVNDQYCLFTFTRNNVEDKQDYNCKVETFDNKLLGTMKNICASSVVAFDQCNSNNYLADFGDGVKAYLVCPSDDRTKLSNFMILITSIKPEEFSSLITDIIISALKGGS